MKEKQLIKNTSSLFIFNIAKMVFPFIILPYLTRVMSTETYGIVAYVKTVMTYMQIVVDFGFMLSATKDIVKSREDKEKMSVVIGDTLFARIMLGMFGFLTVCLLTLFLPILRKNIAYTILSYLVVFLSIFLMDFVFRGLEIMHIITIRFIFMKTLSTILTFFFVNNDNDILLIPIFDIVGSLIAVCLVFYEIKKRSIKIKISKFTNCLGMIKDSFVFFVSNVASTSFNALGTLIIGARINATEVAYWSVCMQIIGTIQACYSPISDGVYPEMIRSRDFSIMKKILKWMTPVIVVGCIVCYACAGIGMYILGGNKYIVAVPVFRLLIPCLFFGFLAIMFGWPTLGAIGKTKETTVSTVISVIIYIFMLLALIRLNKFTLINIAIVRSMTDFVLFAVRFLFFWKYKKLFNNNGIK